MSDLQLSLFSESPVEEDAPSNQPKTIQSNSSLSIDIQNAITSLLTTDKISTRELCETLIEQFKAPKERFSSGKPKIYPTVCIFLESLVQNGQLEFVQEVDRGDRIYKVIK